MTTRRKLQAMDMVQTEQSAQHVALILTGLLFLFGIILLFVPWQQNVSGTGRVVAYAPTQRPQTSKRQSKAE